ncbi:enoyl-CoA hydratase [Pusillimonas sp. ANT_WB101]|uniref:enoyl-CoA hydratase n=1 Tax=Pusillimonas sp. ANT_WB101 TaxID=2597356 RepID=UPI0011EDBBE2|nr:enoyl-CoA hydratase [Pusillimonas sp. ANT_WB101]KAA0892809.1 enoyl-CoA hydratase [Pusillimonas sp. ANT_WB101]
MTNTRDSTDVGQTDNPVTKHLRGEIRYELDEATAVVNIVISNASRYNAMSLSMWRALRLWVERADQDPKAQVIVLRGEGSKAFVSGADISEFSALRHTPAQVLEYEEAVTGAQQSLIHCSKPVIAAIRGVCMGGGIGLALSCDLRYCAHSSRFRMPAAKMGLGYERNAIKRAVDILGAARTTDIFFTARTFNGQEAERIGMVHDAYPDDEFDDRVSALAQTIAGNAPLTLKAAKLAIRSAIEESTTSLKNTADQAVQACFDSQDYQEGQHAFKEKRRPKFTGR